MTKGNTSKPRMLGRLIFGEKRKQHASPSRHRSSTRNGGNLADVSSSAAAAVGSSGSKNLINLHDWAVWRMHLNEQMGNGMSDRNDLKNMRQFLHSNPFYQQHSRDPSNGRYNGVRLLFSIPHPKLKPEVIDGARIAAHKNMNSEISDTTMYDQTNALSSVDERTISSVNTAPASSPIIINKPIHNLMPKAFIGHTGGFLQTNEQMIAAENTRARRSTRTPFVTSDRVNSTLQKAVKDGNVLEKIKAFEMQAAAAQAESTTKVTNGTHGMSYRVQPVTIPVQVMPHRGLSPAIPHRALSPAIQQRTLSPAITRRALSPTVTRPIHYPASPLPIQQSEPIAITSEQKQQLQSHLQPAPRSHRSRHIYPAQSRHDAQMGPIAGRESRKGAHVLEPALGDIILKRRTPSQKTANDEDYSTTMMSSMAFPVSPGPNQRHHHQHHHQQQHHHHRTSASRSRPRKESVHDKRSSNGHESHHKKSQQKQKERTRSSSTKPASRHRWLKGHKETSKDAKTPVNTKETESKTKSSKQNKDKKKSAEQEKTKSKSKTKSAIPSDELPPSDNNRVYGVPNNNNLTEQPRSATTSPDPKVKIDEENESDQDEKTRSNKTSPIPPNEDENHTSTSQYDKPVERQTVKAQSNPKLSSTDADILSKVDDDTRFSRPTDDHARRSELNDEDEACKSEGDVFIEESSLTNINSQQQQQQQKQQQQQQQQKSSASSSNPIRRFSSQYSVDKPPPDRRWQWSKESGGLIDKGNRSKKQTTQNTSSKEKLNVEETVVDDDQIVYETPQSESIHTLTNNTPAPKKKHAKHTKTTTTESSDEPTNTKQVSKQILHAILNSMSHNSEQPTINDFFEHGPYTNPEESLTNITSTA